MIAHSREPPRPLRGAILRVHEDIAQFGGDPLLQGVDRLVGAGRTRPEPPGHDLIFVPLPEAHDAILVEDGVVDRGLVTQGGPRPAPTVHEAGTVGGAPERLPVDLFGACQRQSTMVTS
jgi:hypothetical protein